MKGFKKLLTGILAATLIMGSSLTAFADEPAAASTGIEVQNVIDNETYTAYKILNYTRSGDAVSYYLTASEYASIGSVLEAAGFEFTASSDGSQYYVNNGASFDAAAAAAYLGEHTTNLGSALGTKTATGANGEAKFDDLGTGYFFVTTSAGSLCALHEDSGIETLVEKNTIPTIDKTEKTSGDDYVNGPVDGKIGGTVNYQIVITDGVGTDAAITMTDTMSAGLDYTANTIHINDAPVADNADTDNWTVTVDGRVIKIVFKASYVASLDEGKTINVKYDATINENAVIDNATGNENKVELDYSAQHSEDKVYVETYDFQLYKTDGTNFLDGAGFKLYDAATGGNQITVSKDGKGYYLDAAGDADTEILVNSADGVNVRGLHPGTYYLEETTVPAGYNKLEAREAVTILTRGTAVVPITVVNTSGVILPSTGGIGTTIFYIVGGLLIVAAVVFFVVRRKADAE
ncbi:isopeptide-forming domain-containing fimbrial protein [Butyrivibrio sp. NC2002]|uniref:isopeptide-forming domain-containing fimbrial protein n=1 Tax=Butyrivibrio sp. NC2002 TaxID=1410610 RepID=UPI00055F9F37|nr:isopeptide-forming domain-containing fimbrial protein [Butyrivibrio sp. NC2002]